MPSTQTGLPDPRGPITLAGLLDAMGRYRWAVAAIVLAWLMAGARFAFLAQPVYKADMLIQLDDGATSSSARGWLGDVAALFDIKSSASAEAQIIASRLVVTRAVDVLQRHVDIAPRRLPLIGELATSVDGASGWPGWLGLSGYAWGSATAKVASFEVPSVLEGRPFRLIRISARTWQFSGPGLAVPVQGEIGVERVVASSAGDIRLLVSALDAAPGTPFTLYRRSRQKVVDEVRSLLAVQERVKQSGMIVATLKGHDPGQVGALLREIGAQYIRQNVERKAAEAAQSLDFLDVQLPKLKQQLELVQDRYTTMNVDYGIIDLPEEVKLSLKSAADAQTKLMLLLQKRDELATRFTSAHPAMVAIARQIAAVREQKQGLDHTVKRLPALQQRAAELKLDMRVATDLYTVLLGSTQQLQLLKAGRVASARIVDVAMTPDTPVRRNRVVMMVVALLGGLICGTGFAYVMSWLLGAVSEADDIEGALGIGVLGTMPQSAQQSRLVATAEKGQQRLLALAAPSDPAIESLRSLRTALMLSNASRDKNVLMITAAEPSAGKSFLAANLAAVLGASGQRVLLVDADVHRGYLHESFGVPQSPGLSDFLAGEVKLDDIVHAGPAPGVDLITGGTMRAQADDYFIGAGLAPVLDACRADYAWIIVDTPPILAVADTTMLTRHANVLWLVARAGQSRLGDLRESCKRLRVCGLAPTAVILNGVVQRLGRYGATYCTYGGYRAERGS
ncbi:tyrosine protein kinase [Cupriavidus pauculus]|uniref:non-specific protein-tyrosine kinase n=2 Tax=Cupriavidus pauculus TaxID=82633 RepID=A0A2N5CD96_9BURK|nr:tyrosine protein kinase [Cupriavidus pauculus]